MGGGIAVLGSDSPATADGDAPRHLPSGTVPLIDLGAQYNVLHTEIDARIRRVLQHQQFILGPEVEELEHALAECTGARHVVSVASGSDALKIPLMAEGIGRGDAVFVPAFTFVATAEVVAELGATPVFVDIDPATFNMDPDQLEKCVEQTRKDTSLRPRVVIPVDLFGRPADYPAINRFAGQEGLLVVADAAQSFGASLDDRRVGTLADVASTSFYPSKTLGGYGDGGCVFTDDLERAEAMESIARHGFDRRGESVVNIGMNSRLDTLQAAILLAKLGVLEDELRSRRAMAGYYDDRLRDLVDLPAPYQAGIDARSIYPILTDRRDRIRQVLADAGIATAVYYPTPLHLQPAYTRFGEGPGSFPVSERICGQILALPLHPYLEEATVDRICSTIREALS